jgi:hypothetical protein
MQPFAHTHFPPTFSIIISLFNNLSTVTPGYFSSRRVLEKYYIA